MESRTSMLRSALLFVTAVLLALTAGRAFWVWLGESPIGVAAPTYVDFFQQIDKRIAVPIAIIGTLGPILAGICAIICRANRRMLFFLVAACGFGAVSVLVTVLINVPINEQIAGWDPAALPPGYEHALRRWLELAHRAADYERRCDVLAVRGPTCRRFKERRASRLVGCAARKNPRPQTSARERPDADALANLRDERPAHGARLLGATLEQRLDFARDSR